VVTLNHSINTAINYTTGYTLFLLLIMEILGSTQYVDLKVQKEPWYQLSVINMWDWKTKSVCYDYAGKTLISYCLYKCTPISENQYNQEIVEELTDEMKETLIANGYAIK